MGLLLKLSGRAFLPGVVADGQASTSAAHVQPPCVAYGPAALPCASTRVAVPEKAIDQDGESRHRFQAEKLQPVRTCAKDQLGLHRCRIAAFGDGNVHVGRHEAAALG